MALIGLRKKNTVKFIDTTKLTNDIFKFTVAVLAGYGYIVLIWGK